MNLNNSKDVEQNESASKKTPMYVRIKIFSPRPVLLLLAPLPPRKKGKWTTSPEHCVTVYPCCVFQGTPGVDLMLTNMYPGKNHNTFS